MNLRQQLRQKHIVEDPDQRSQWTYVGRTFSAVEDELYPWDSDVVKAIRADLLPDFVPLVAKTIYRSPAGTDRVWTHHAWGYLVHDPEAVWKHVRVLWPSSPASINYYKGRFSDRLMIPPFGFLGQMGDSIKSPGRIRPIGWNLYHQIKSMLHVGAHQSAEEQAWSEIDAIDAQEAKDKADALDLVDHLAESNARRWAGDPMVAVPSSFSGEV